MDYVRNMEDDEVMGARCRPGSEEYARDASVKRNIGVIHDAMRTRSKMAIAVGFVAAVVFLAVVVTAVVTTVLVTEDEKEKLENKISDAKTELEEKLEEKISDAKTELKDTVKGLKSDVTKNKLANTGKA